MKLWRTLWILLMTVCFVALAVPVGSGDPAPIQSEAAASADSMLGHVPSLADGVADELPLDYVLEVLIVVISLGIR